jgi:peptidoglycan/LPS O-acetylase OafA/YrhL
MTESRLPGADFVRASACCLVLFHHLAQRMSETANLGGMEWLRAFLLIGGYGVAAFFVLSGFLLARPFWQALRSGAALPSLRIYTLRRAARILPGFWLALTVSFILSFAVFGAVLDGQLILRYVAGVLALADWHWVTLFPVEVNGPLWSISFEITSYLLLPLGFAAIFLLPRRMGAAWGPLLWLGVIGAALVAHGLFVALFPMDEVRRGWEFGLMGGAKTWMPRYNPFAFFAMFAIGALAAGVQVYWIRRRIWVFDLVALAAAAWAIERLIARVPLGWDDLYGLDVPYDFPWFVLPVAIFLAVAPMSAVLGRLLDNPPVRYVARISFGIYVWHYLVLELVRKFWDAGIDHGAATDPARFAISCAIVIVASVAIAHVSFVLLEAPVMRWARTREGVGPEAETARLSSAAR